MANVNLTEYSRRTANQLFALTHACVGVLSSNHSVSPRSLLVEPPTLIVWLRRAFHQQALLRNGRRPPSVHQAQILETSCAASLSESGLARRTPFLSVAQEIVQNLKGLRLEACDSSLAADLASVCFFALNTLRGSRDVDQDLLPISKTLIRRGVRALATMDRCDPNCEAFLESMRELVVSWRRLHRNRNGAIHAHFDTLAYRDRGLTLPGQAIHDVCTFPASCFRLVNEVVLTLCVAFAVSSASEYRTFFGPQTPLDLDLIPSSLDFVFSRAPEPAEVREAAIAFQRRCDALGDEAYRHLFRVLAFAPAAGIRSAVIYCWATVEKISSLMRTAIDVILRDARYDPSDPARRPKVCLNRLTYLDLNSIRVLRWCHNAIGRHSTLCDLLPRCRQLWFDILNHSALHLKRLPVRAFLDGRPKDSLNALSADILLHGVRPYLGRAVFRRARPDVFGRYPAGLGQALPAASRHVSFSRSSSFDMTRIEACALCRMIHELTLPSSALHDA